MHKELKKDFQEIAGFNFPTKAFLRGASTTKEYRREQFDQYVQLLVKIILSDPSKEMPKPLKDFLSNTGKVRRSEGWNECWSEGWSEATAATYR